MKDEEKDLAARLECVRAAKKVLPRGQVIGDVVKPIALYLPQYHAIPENDEWWGKGFTEWTNVRKAKPLFEGHYQPHVPHKDVGYYDLSDVEVMRRQVRMAKEYGIFGFCFYYYHFANGKRLLEKPINNYLAAKDIDFPFCFCWANENWTRKWDGGESDVIMAQDYGRENMMRMFKDMLKAFKDPRYIKVGAKKDIPILMVYRPEVIPQMKEVCAEWRKMAREAGFRGVYLVASRNFVREISDPRDFGMDAAYDFFVPGKVSEGFRMFRGRNLNVATCELMMHAAWRNLDVPYPCYKGVTPEWDNTPRRGAEGAFMIGVTPRKFRMNLEDVCYQTIADSKIRGNGFVFINAWNEWGEGAHLEPDKKNGYAYLKVVRKVMKSRLPREWTMRRWAKGASHFSWQHLREKHSTLYYMLKIAFTFMRLRPHEAMCIGYQFWKVKKAAIQNGQASGMAQKVVAGLIPFIEKLKSQSWINSRLDVIKKDAAPLLDEVGLAADFEDRMSPLDKGLQEAGRVVSSAARVARTEVQKDYMADLMYDVRRFDWKRFFFDVRDEYVKSEDVLALISSPDIKVVSFDVFDTLLSLPCVFPSDIFYLIAKVVDEKYGIDFVKMRQTAEEEVGGRFERIDEVYRQIKRTTGLPTEVVNDLKTFEFRTVRALLFPREIVRTYYEAAVRAGKRIIAISDKGLAPKMVKGILSSKRYDQVDEVYASYEEMALKADGEIFRNVLEKEGIANYQMLHIGDNRRDDYEQPMKMGIPSVCVPTVMEFASRPGSLWNYTYGYDGFSKDPMTRILMGGVVRVNEKAIVEARVKGLLPSGELMGAIGFAPAAMALALYALNGQKICRGGDGTILQKVYEFARKAAQVKAMGEGAWVGAEEVFAAVLGARSQVGETAVWEILQECFCAKDGQSQILDGALESARKVLGILGHWCVNVKTVPSNDVLRPLIVSLYKSPYCEVRYLAHVGTLAEKIFGSAIYEKNRMLGLGVCDWNLRYDYVPVVSGKCKLGLHIHLFHIDLMWEFISYAKNLPRGSEVFITTPYEEQVRCIQEAFGAALPALKVTVIHSGNRGRDVGPWLVETYAHYSRFDYFCHVHSKKSVHTGEVGASWRRYLLDNLLTAKALERIVGAFEGDAKLGVIAPSSYAPILSAFFVDGPWGSNKENIEALMKRITGQEYSMVPSDLVFSSGTMFWFRPAALKSLYDLKLQYEDFPAEPTGLDGTLAHAIERAIGCVCEQAGYRFCFLNVDE